MGGDQFSAIQTLFRIFSNVTAITPTAPAPMALRPAPLVAVQPDLPAPSPRVPNLPPTALSPRVTIVPPVFNPNKPPNHPASPAPVRAVPSTRVTSPAPVPVIIEPDRQEQFFNRVITFGHVPVCLSPTVVRLAPNYIMLSRSANSSNRKSKPTLSLTRPAVRRSNIGTSSVAMTAPPGSRHSPTI